MTAPTRPTFRALLLALALTSTLTGCQGENPDLVPTRAPDLGVRCPAPPAPLTVPLTPDAPALLTGEGGYQDGMLRRSPSFQSCASRTPTCAAWSAPLPPPRPGYELRVMPLIPLYDLTGASIVTVSPDQASSCEEALKVQAQVSTDLDPAPVDLIGGPVTVAPGAARLAVQVCAYGVLSARLGPLTGTASYVPSAP